MMMLGRKRSGRESRQFDLIGQITKHGFHSLSEEIQLLSREEENMEFTLDCGGEYREQRKHVCCLVAF